MKIPNKKKRRYLISTGILLFLFYWFSLPEKLFDKPTSLVIQSNQGSLLGARIAKDGQWRFPKLDSVPEKFKLSIINFEDRYFYHHPGVNLFSLFRAAYQDIKARKIVSGGSTISMQCIRMAYDNPSRNIYQKVKEIILATRLELRYSKDEILNLYASNAPFGSNVVGLEAASWRFFGRQPSELSWAEAATLAVLPNAPALIYPGKNEGKLRKKRNRLLHKLMERNIIDSLTYSLSIEEELPTKVKPLPNLAPHLLEHIQKQTSGVQLKTTLDFELQKKCNQILKKMATKLRSNRVYNAAIIVVEVETGNILAYIGNSPPPNDGQDHGNYVDVIQARRSSGSILKPLLYAYLLQEGKILPRTMIPDIPTEISGYQPKNFNQDYSGVVPADKALQRSLNIPAVRELQMYGYPRFHLRLKEVGFTTIDRSADHYGLTLILGGAEVKLWDLAKVYSSMARVLNHYHIDAYDKTDWRDPQYLPQRKTEQRKGKILDATSIWFTFEAMRNLERPQNESGWNLFSSSRKIAWKTGTSHGFRDAWTIGVDPKYLVGVWIGNADGEGRAGMTGINTAAPLMFQIFDLLPNTQWFNKPQLEMLKSEICVVSGFRAGPNCPEVRQEYIPKKGTSSRLCPYHKLIHLDESGSYQVTSHCESVSKMQHRKMFVLPPTQAWYYKQQHPEYISPPPFRPNCLGTTSFSMEMIYPKSGAHVFIPKEHNGKRGAVVFQASHKQDNMKIYWHLDQKYIGFTQGLHQMSLSPKKGRHQLSLVDENGDNIRIWFWVEG